MLIYQTVIAATADILEILSRIWTDPTLAEGVVLIDELDAHLHPAWQMRIVGSLRRALPGAQFIATTHQPLCLRGLGAGEVLVVRRSADGAIDYISDLPSPADIRVDQLLTSPFFGLNSTSDPETEILFDRYYALLAFDARSPDQEAELVHLGRASKAAATSETRSARRFISKQSTRFSRARKRVRRWIGRD